MGEKQVTLYPSDTPPVKDFMGGSESSLVAEVGVVVPILLSVRVAVLLQQGLETGAEVAAQIEGGADDVVVAVVTELGAGEQGQHLAAGQYGDAVFEFQAVVEARLLAVVCG